MTTTAYWGSRREMLYYTAVFQIVSVVGQDAKSIIDVGSANTDYILRMSWIPKKVQLNKGFPRCGDLPGVERISADFYEWEPDELYDVVLCLQVLEHVPDPLAFCDRLKQSGRRLVISVPYKWKGGTGHIHDPVDEQKVEAWMGRRPNYSLMVTEPFGPARLIAYYDLEGGEKVRISSQFAREAIAEKTSFPGDMKILDWQEYPEKVAPGQVESRSGLKPIAEVDQQDQPGTIESLRKSLREKDKLVARLKAKVAQLDSEYKGLRDDVARLLLIHKIRKVASETLPNDSKVIVVSKGDDELLKLGGRRQGWHFPRSEGGVYAGYYPGDSAEAIEYLEALRAAGAEFLLFPVTALWWLDHYYEFKQHLERHYPLLIHQQDSCLILDLRHPVSDHAGAGADDDTIAAAWAAIKAALSDAEAVDLSWVQPPPRDNAWTMAPDALRFLVSLLAQLKPQHILEFGSGLSTRVLARACAEYQPACCVTSVDHDPEFGRKAERDLASDETAIMVGFQIAPLVARNWKGKLLPVYLLGRWDLVSQTPPDLILIDGPPELLGGREGVLYQALEFARPGTIILVDDAKREGELAALANWQANLRGAIEVSLLPGFVKGLAAIVVRDPATMTS